MEVDSKKLWTADVSTASRTLRRTSQNSKKIIKYLQDVKEIFPYQTFNSLCINKKGTYCEVFIYLFILYMCVLFLVPPKDLTEFCAV